MALSSDKDGFLVGPRVDVAQASRGRHIELLRTIRGDVSSMAEDLSAIRKVLSQPVRARAPSASPALRLVNSSAAAAPGRGARSAGPTTVPAAATPSKIGAAVQQQADKAQRQPRAPKATQAPQAARPRTADGRFGSKPKGPNDSGETEERKSRESTRSIAEAASDLKRGAADMLSNAEQADPAMAAAKELKDLASPVFSMLKPIGGLFRRKAGGSEEEKVHAKTVPWYRRMWRELRDLNRKPAGGKGMLGGLGGLLMKLPGIGVIGGALSKLGGVIGPLATRLGGAIRPLLGGLAKLGLPVAAMFSAFKSFNTSTEEYAARMGVELNGSLAQELGVRFVGVLGDLGNTLTFGLAGKFGELVAPAVSDAFIAMGTAWDDTNAWVKEKWTGVTTAISSTWDGAVKSITGAFDGISEWVSKKVGRVTEVATNAVTAVKTTAGEVYDRGAGVAETGVNAARNALNTVTGGRYGGGSNANKAAVVHAMNANGIKDPKEQAMFMAQLDHESSGFKRYEENLNYSAKGLRTTFGKYYKTDAEAAADARNPEAIANKVYGGRMGNTEAGDGWKYRGRGAIQLTGKSNYAEAGKALNLDLLNNPDLAKDPQNAANISAWYWKKNQLGAAGRAGDVIAATKKINGGTNGLEDREAKYNDYLKSTSTGELTVQTINDMKAVPPPAVSAAISSATTMQAAPSVPRLLAPITASQPPLSYSPAAQDVAKYTPGSAPAAKARIAGNDKGKSETVQVKLPLTQDVADRNIAAVATGGIGMGPVR